MARRILFTSQKGGVGKSTLARWCAAALAYREEKVLLADFDAEQGTCVRWRAQRAARDITPLIETRAFTKPSKLDKFNKAYTNIVIDAAGRLDDMAVELAQTADAVFLPSSFSLDDLLPTLKIIETLRREAPQTQDICVVFCRTGGSTAQEKQARSILSMNNVSTLSQVMAQKDGYATLNATGRTGREAANRHLREAALALDTEMLEFIDNAAAAKSATLATNAA